MKLILAFLVLAGLNFANASGGAPAGFPDIDSDEFQDKLSVSHTKESNGLVCASDDLANLFAGEASYDMSWYSPVLRLNGESLIEMKTLDPHTGKIVGWIGNVKDYYDEENISLNLKTLVALRINVEPYQKVVEYQVSIKAKSPEKNNIYAGVLSATYTDVDKKAHPIGSPTQIVKDVKIKCGFKNPSDAD